MLSEDADGSFSRRQLIAAAFSCHFDSLPLLISDVVSLSIFHYFS